MISPRRSLWGRCGRHNSHPAISVVDFIFYCPDSCRLTQGIHLSFGLHLLLPGCSISRVFIPTYLGIVSYVSLALSAHLCVIIYLQSFTNVLISPWSLSTCVHDHLHIIISVISSFFTSELDISINYITYSVADCTIISWIFPLTCGGFPLSLRSPDILLQLFHPNCVLMLTSAFMFPSLCRVIPIYLRVVTCGSWAHRLITLPNGVPLS